MSHKTVDESKIHSLLVASPTKQARQTIIRDATTWERCSEAVAGLCRKENFNAKKDSYEFSKDEINLFIERLFSKNPKRKGKTFSDIGKMKEFTVITFMKAAGMCTPHIGAFKTVTPLAVPASLVENLKMARALVVYDNEAASRIFINAIVIEAMRQSEAPVALFTETPLSGDVSIVLKKKPTPVHLSGSLDYLIAEPDGTYDSIEDMRRLVMTGDANPKSILLPIEAKRRGEFRRGGPQLCSQLITARSSQPEFACFQGVVSDGTNFQFYELEGKNVRISQPYTLNWSADLMDLGIIIAQFVRAIKAIAHTTTTAAHHQSPGGTQTITTTSKSPGGSTLSTTSVYKPATNAMATSGRPGPSLSEQFAAINVNMEEKKVLSTAPTSEHKDYNGADEFLERDYDYDDEDEDEDGEGGDEDVDDDDDYED